MKIPPRALNAANRILARIPSTKWTPAERDVAAAIIGNETGQELALEVCKMLLSALRLRNEGCLIASTLKIELAEKKARLALRR